MIYFEQLEISVSVSSGGEKFERWCQGESKIDKPIRRRRHDVCRLCSRFLGAAQPSKDEYTQLQISQSEQSKNKGLSVVVLPVVHHRGRDLVLLLRLQKFSDRSVPGASWSKHLCSDPRVRVKHLTY